MIAWCTYEVEGRLFEDDDWRDLVGTGQEKVVERWDVNKVGSATYGEQIGL